MKATIVCYEDIPKVINDIFNMASNRLGPRANLEMVPGFYLRDDGTEQSPAKLGCLLGPSLAERDNRICFLIDLRTEVEADESYGLRVLKCIVILRRLAWMQPAEYDLFCKLVNNQELVDALSAANLFGKASREPASVPKSLARDLTEAAVSERLETTLARLSAAERKPFGDWAVLDFNARIKKCKVINDALEMTDTLAMAELLNIEPLVLQNAQLAEFLRDQRILAIILTSHRNALQDGERRLSKVFGSGIVEVQIRLLKDKKSVEQFFGDRTKHPLLAVADKPTERERVMEALDMFF